MNDQQQLAPPQNGPDDTLEGLMGWTHLSREDLEEVIELLRLAAKSFFTVRPDPERRGCQRRSPVTCQTTLSIAMRRTAG